MLRSVPAGPDLVYAGSLVGSDDGDDVNATFTSLPRTCGRARAHAVPRRELASPTGFESPEAGGPQWSTEEHLATHNDLPAKPDPVHDDGEE